MLERLIALSLRNRLLVAVFAIAVAVWGAATLVRLPVDVLPDLTRPTVTVLTESHGLLPVDVERLVTVPIERAVSGAANVSRVRSASSVGLSIVWVEFDWETDVYRNRQLVEERLQLARERMPDETHAQILPAASLMGQVLLAGARPANPDVTSDEVRSWVDQILVPRLLAERGVAQVVASGGAARQLQAVVSTDRLLETGVSVHELVEAVRNTNLNAGGGVLESGARGPMVNVTGALKDGAPLANAVVRDDPVRPLTVRDLGEVRFGPAAVRTGSAGVMAKDGVVIAVVKQPGEDTIELTDRLNVVMEQMQGAAPASIELFPSLYRQSDFIQRGIDNVEEAVLLGALLVVLIVFLFQMNVRSTVITLTALPLSVAATALVFQMFGLSVNTMTLGGLAVAVGALVDDAIVDVENVYRRLRENARSGKGRAVLDVVYAASCEVRRPIVIGTLVVCAVYVPLFALSGMEGRLFAPIGVAYIVSILASLLVAVTVTPVMCSWLLASAPSLMRERETPAVRALRAVARRLIGLGMDRAPYLAGVFLALVLAAGLALSGRGTEFLPAFNEGTAQVNLTLPPGTSLDASSGFATLLEEAALEVDGVRTVLRRTGRAEEDAHAHDVNASEMIVTFHPDSERAREDVLEDLRSRLAAKVPGVEIEVEQPLGHMLSHLLSGIAAQVAIKIEGPDLQVLRGLALEVESVVDGVPGAVDVFRERQVLVEQVEVKPDRPRMARLGVTVADVANAVEFLMEGAPVSELRQGSLRFPIVLRLRAEDRRNLDDLRRLPVRHAGDQIVRLGDVAWVGRTRTPNSINRENGVRRVAVQHNVSGRPLGDVVADVQAGLETVRGDLPAGYTIRVGGQYEAQQSASRWLVVLGGIAFLLVALLVFSQFRSVALTIQTMLDIPMAAIGAVAFLLITDQTLSVATLVGLISLGGIAVRNKVLLLDHYIHITAESGGRCTRDVILRAGQERIVPVLMTALTSGIALIPLLSPGEPGRELLYPVATVIVGGLLSTTLLDVLLTPALFTMFGVRAAERVAALRTRRSALP